MITYDQFRAMLPTHKHRLDDELELHAQLMEQISTEVVTRNSRMIEAKDALAIVEARIGDEVKEDFPKLSLSMVDAKVKQDPERIRAWQKFQLERSEHEKWSGLLDAWRQKGYSIKTLADLYASQYFSLQSHQINERKSRDGPERQAQVREAMREAKPTRSESTTRTRRSIIDV